VTLEEKTYALLAGDAGVAALTSRVLPPGDWQNVTAPYIVHFPVSVDPQRTSQGIVPLKQWFYQVSCFAATYSAALFLSRAVISALDGTRDGVTYFWRDQTATYERDAGDSGIHQIALTFEVFEAL
jgi:hypothetical protein